MTTRLFNPGPGTFVSPTGGVFAPGEHFHAELSDALYAAVDRGRLLVVDEPEIPVLEPAQPDVEPLQSFHDAAVDAIEEQSTDGGDEITEVGSEDEIVIDDTPAPKPGPPAKKTTSKTAQKED